MKFSILYSLVLVPLVSSQAYLSLAGGKIRHLKKHHPIYIVKNELQEYYITLKKLKGILFTESLSNIPDGKSVSIQFSHLTDIEDGALCSTAVEELELGFVHTAKIAGDMFGNCPSLKKLTLLRMDNVTIESDAFAGLKNLEELYINSEINLRKISPQLLQNQAKLRILEIAHTNLVTIENGAFDNLKSVTHLAIRSNPKLRHLDGVFGKLQTLRFLSLEDNIIEFLPFGRSQVLEELEFVKLSENKIRTVLADRLIRSLPKLKRIDFTRNPIPCPDLKALAKVVQEIGKAEVHFTPC